MSHGVQARPSATRKLNIDREFINAIFRHHKASIMQSKTKEFMAELELNEIQELHLKSFELYEEYSQRPIAETIRICRQNFNETDLRAKRELLTEVEEEITNFRVWLEETKNHERATAHYYSVSLKSLLLGLPVGIQVAQLFSEAIDALTRK